MYTVLEKLGSGAFGDVHKVRHSNGSIYAMKKFIVGDGSRELDKLKMLEHPNIVAYYGFTQHCSDCFVIIEYCSRGDFYNFSGTASNIYTISNVIDWSGELFSALYYLEQQQIQHRDIKPQNVLLDEEYHLKLCDFGISKRFDTRGVTGGTPRYCSPEEGDNPKGDVYSAGLVLWEMIMRKMVFSSHKENSMFDYLTLETPECRTELADLVSRCTRKDVNERISSEEALRISSSLKQNSYYTAHKRPPTQLCHVGNCSPECEEMKHRPIGVLSDRTPIPDVITCEWISGTAHSALCGRCEEFERALAAKQDENDELNRLLEEQRRYQSVDSVVRMRALEEEVDVLHLKLNEKIEEHNREQQKWKEEIERLEEKVSKRNEEISSEEEKKHDSMLEINAFSKQEEAQELQRQQEGETERKLQEALKNPVNVRRFAKINHDWKISPSSINRLYISANKPMYLCAISMHRCRTQNVNFTIRLTGPNYVDMSVHWTDSSLNYDRLDLATPLQMIPGFKYLLNLTVDKQCEMFYGHRGQRSRELEDFPEYEVEFSNYEGSETTVERGLFRGFNFAPIPCRSDGNTLTN